jgi:resuscitation-promoting factor RpfE
MRKVAIACLSMAAILLVPTSAAEAKAKRTSCSNTKLVAKYSANYHAVAKLHGERAPGRNIRKWGLSEGHKSKCRHLAKSLRTLRAMRFPGSRMLHASRPYTPPAQTRTLRAGAGGTLAAIRACESGGNYGTNTGNGFYGAYQFTQSTWSSVGGSGNPASASPAEQDKRAAMLYAREGASPWPVCGR